LAAYYRSNLSAMLASMAAQKGGRAGRLKRRHNAGWRSGALVRSFTQSDR
jgi:hypothetical protein